MILMSPVFTDRMKDGLIDPDMVYLAHSTILETTNHTMIFRGINKHVINCIKV